MNDSTSLKTRRQFLRTSLLGGALTWTVPTFLARTFAEFEAAAEAGMVPGGQDAPILVVLQMAGGNDGLNTVVPLGDDHYHRARPRIGLKADSLLRLGDTVGLHPSLGALHALYEQGLLAVVQGVGYPNPNRSHFRSTEIWQTASDAGRFERHGWIGRFFDNSCAGADPTVGVCIGRQMPQAFSSPVPRGIALQNAEAYRLVGLDPSDGLTPEEEAMVELNRPEEDSMSGDSISSLPGRPGSDLSALDYVERTALDAQVSSEQIRQLVRRGANLTSYPPTQLAAGLKLVARLVAGGLPTRVYYVSQGGYDTHTNQVPTQARLLQEMADAVKAFIDDLKAQGNLDRVVLMTFSEFGRRVQENANQGTDHGAAAPMFLAGSAVKPGLLGRYPSLALHDLLKGDLKYTVDFRSVYASVLENWLGVRSQPILGRPFEPLPLIRA